MWVIFLQVTLMIVGFMLLVLLIKKILTKHYIYKRDDHVFGIYDDDIDPASVMTFEYKLEQSRRKRLKEQNDIELEIFLVDIYQNEFSIDYFSIKSIEAFDENYRVVLDSQTTYVINQENTQLLMEFIDDLNSYK